MINIYKFDRHPFLATTSYKFHNRPNKSKPSRIYDYKDKKQLKSKDESKADKKGS